MLAYNDNRIQATQLPLGQRALEVRRVAVLLNANARRVNTKTVEALGSAIGAHNVLLSRSEADASRLVTHVLDARYDAVFLGGGDGTLMCFLNAFLNQVAERRRVAPVDMPRIGVLKLGTGNSVASWVNASPQKGDSMVDDVLRAKLNQVPNTRTIDLLDIEGHRAPFAGLGLDGKLLNDYVWVKNNLGQGALKKAMTGPGGYLTSVALRTVPHYLFNPTAVECEVMNVDDAPAWRLSSTGACVGPPIGRGETLFRGKLILAAAGTVPFYGYELRTFPFAGQRRGMMHLRLGNVSAVHALANLPGLWRGTWFPSGVHDFSARTVTIRSARPLPLQIAGDAAGERASLTISMASESVDLFDFNRTAEVISMTKRRA